MAGFLILILLTPTLAIGVWRYLAGTRRLRDRIEAETPALFERLGRPRTVHRATGLPGMNTLTPLGPWLAWILAPTRHGGVPFALRDDHRRQRRLLRLCLLGFVLWIWAFFAAGPPDAP